MMNGSPWKGVIGEEPIIYRNQHCSCVLCWSFDWINALSRLPVSLGERMLRSGQYLFMMVPWYRLGNGTCFQKQFAVASWPLRACYLKLSWDNRRNTPERRSVGWPRAGEHIETINVPGKWFQSYQEMLRLCYCQLLDSVVRKSRIRISMLLA
jgi:hypothetical protein